MRYMHLQEPLGPDRMPALKFLVMTLQYHLEKYKGELLRLRAEAGVVQHQTSDPFCVDDHPLCASWAARVRDPRLHIWSCKCPVPLCALPSLSAGCSWPRHAASVGLQWEPQLLLPLHDMLSQDVQPGICNHVSPCDCLHRGSAVPTPITCVATRGRMGASLMVTAV